MPISVLEKSQEVVPLCPVFGQCGGCAYQHLSYATELQIKENGLQARFKETLQLNPGVFEPITASPKNYHYRSRLDLTLRKTREGLVFGFTGERPPGQVDSEGRRLPRNFIIPVDHCSISMEPISDFIPDLKRQASAVFPEDYRIANLTVRTSDDGRVFWGGIGRRSLRMLPKDYFWTEIEGLRIFYSLETFFQSNLSILPRVVNRIKEWLQPDPETLFWDLYSGVGLFGFSLAREMGKIVMVEEAPASIELARYNAAYHHFQNVEIREAKVEAPGALDLPGPASRQVALIDPPRRGLSEPALEALSGFRFLDVLLYLSCHPDSLIRDLSFLVKKGWEIVKVAPFDFFPRTSHLETLVMLQPVERKKS